MDSVSRGSLREEEEEENNRDWSFPNDRVRVSLGGDH